MQVQQKDSCAYHYTVSLSTKTRYKVLVIKPRGFIINTFSYKASNTFRGKRLKKLTTFFIEYICFFFLYIIFCRALRKNIFFVTSPPRISILINKSLQQNVCQLCIVFQLSRSMYWTSQVCVRFIRCHIIILRT